jgi:hypothetical protein
MDVRKWTQLFFRVAAGGSLVLMGSAVLLAGDRQHEQPTRPHTSAADSPNWGFNQTCWSRFPAVPDCPGNSREFSTGGSGYETYLSQPMYFAPQNATMMHEHRPTAPEYGFPNSPINVYPNTSPAAQDQKSGGAAAPSRNGNPQIPDPGAMQSPPIPGVPSTLPPLPAPPLPAPGQSSFRPNMTDPDWQMMARTVSTSGSTLQTGARYAIPGRSGMPASASAPIASGSYSGNFVSNTHSPSAATAASRYGTARPAQQMPVGRPMYAETYGPVMNANVHGMTQPSVALLSQSRVLPNSAAPTSNWSGNVMSREYNPTRPLFYPAQLPQTSIYPTMRSEPLRNTP